MLQERLAGFASRYFPEVDLHTISHSPGEMGLALQTAGLWSGGSGEVSVSRSSGVMGLAPDGLPLVGALPDLPRAYFAVGLGGRGLAWAFVVAERLVELALHDADPGLFSAVRLG